MASTLEVWIDSLLVENMLLWVLREDLKGETGSVIIEAQDQEFQIKYHSTKILQTETDSKCRL